MAARDHVKDQIARAEQVLRDEWKLDPVGVGVGGNSERGFTFSVILPEVSSANRPLELFGVPVEYQFLETALVSVAGNAVPAWRQASLKRRFHD